MRKEIEITTEYITLGQLLTFAGIIRSGALAKEYLVTNEVYVNEELEARRGRKLYKGYKVLINNTEYTLV
jgi:ribosome-associated protein YbcJ (S4-like RNA binding protein)